MKEIKEAKPGYALCPIPPPAPNVTYKCTMYGCGAEFFTDDTGEYWYHIWCDDHGQIDDCADALKRIYSIPEYRQQTALDIRTIEKE